MSLVEKRLKLRKLFKQNAELPKTEEDFKDWFETLRAEMSPENLTCDGELSQAQIKKRLKDIKAEWAELEQMYGKSVPMEY